MREAVRLALAAAVRPVLPPPTGNPLLSALLCRASVPRSSWNHSKVDCQRLGPQAASEPFADSESKTARQAGPHLDSQQQVEQVQEAL